MSESEKYEATIRKDKVASKEDVKRMNQWGKSSIKEGDTYSYIPEPKNLEEVFERFEKLESQKLLEFFQNQFHQKVPKPNLRIINENLKELDDFIDSTECESITEAFKNKYETGETLYKHEYLRLTNHYYENPILKFRPYEFFNPIASFINGKYILYRNWLLDLQNQFEGKNTESKEAIDDYQNLLKSIVRSSAIMYDVGTRYHIKPHLCSEKRPWGALTKELFNWDEKSDKYLTMLRSTLLTIEVAKHDLILNEINLKVGPIIQDYLNWYNSEKAEERKNYWVKSNTISPYEVLNNKFIKFKEELQSCFTKEVSPASFFSKAMAKRGINLIPIHSFEELKSNRLLNLQEEKNKFILEQELNGVETTPKDIEYFFEDWKAEEFEKIEKWESNKENKRSTKVEIKKYKEFIENLTNIPAENPNPDHPQDINPDEDLKEDLKNKFRYLLDQGRKPIPQMNQDQFNAWIEEVCFFFLNDYTVSNRVKKIDVENVGRKQLLKILKTYYYKHSKKARLIQSLADLANLLSDPVSWEKQVTIESIQRA